MKNTKGSSKKPEPKSKSPPKSSPYASTIALLVVVLGFILYLVVSPETSPNKDYHQPQPVNPEKKPAQVINVFEKDEVLIDFSQHLQVCLLSPSTLPPPKPGLT